MEEKFDGWFLSPKDIRRFQQCNQPKNERNPSNSRKKYDNSIIKWNGITFSLVDCFNFGFFGFGQFSALGFVGIQCFATTPAFTYSQS